MSLASNSLLQRSHLLTKTRAFFSKRGILEVDVPALSPYGAVDAYIDLIEATVCGKKAYLHSSPEYGMKMLLAKGMGDIYQLSHVFRDHEKGERHLPEFMMAEWYRQNFAIEQMIEETCDFARLFVALPLVETMSYRAAFERYVGHYPSTQEERDPLFATEIEPHLEATIIKGFPEEMKALAHFDGQLVHRFELFVHGYEVANGYLELTDPVEQQTRLEEANRRREVLGKPCYPIDPQFIGALEKGIGSCCGVAVGFDRLMMLHLETDQITEAVYGSFSF